MNILQYESKIWATADLLRGSGIKESERPSFMMPFLGGITNRATVGDYFFKETEDLVGKLCDDFEATIRK